MKRKYFIFALPFLILSCNNNDDDNNTDRSSISDHVSALPSRVNYPEDNTYSAEKEDLGRFLFWDPIMSGDKDVSCATCHHPELAYADAIDLSLGVGGSGLGTDRQGGDLVPRNAPTILNTAFNGIDNDGNYNIEEAPMFWDSRTESLENQALQPFLSAEEMRGDNIGEDDIMDTIIERLSNISEYQELFSSAFGSTEITEERILQAIATFERGIVANNSPFDQYMRGDNSAMTDEQIEGLETFIEVGCADCHSGAMFSDYELHTLGVPDHDLVQDDKGATDNFDFRTPTLRNIELTAPYMHNGVIESLEDVVEFYDDISQGRENDINDNLDFEDLDPEIRDLSVRRGDIDEIVAFLEALTDEGFDVTVPESVPSGLNVGGDID